MIPSNRPVPFHSLIAEDSRLLGNTLIVGRDTPNPFNKNNPKPKTPIIAGTVCGGVVLLAWIIGFGIYFRKRCRRKKRKRLVAAGKTTHPDVEAEAEGNAPQVVVPPDPAVLGYHHDSDKAPSANELWQSARNGELTEVTAKKGLGIK